MKEQRQVLSELGFQTRQQAEELRGSSAAGRGTSDFVEAEVIAQNAEDAIGAIDAINIEDLGDIDTFLQGVENELLVLEETCRIVEEDGSFQDEDSTHWTGPTFDDHLETEALQQDESFPEQAIGPVIQAGFEGGDHERPTVERHSLPGRVLQFEVDLESGPRSAEMPP